MTQPNPVQPQPGILVPVPLRALEEILSHFAASGWTRADRPSLGQAWDEVPAAQDAALGHTAAGELHARLAGAPAEPQGDYAVVHVMGHEQREGWVTDGSVAGAACLDVRDAAGRLIAKIPPHSVYMVEPALPPEALPRLAGPDGWRPALPPPAQYHDSGPQAVMEAPGGGVGYGTPWDDQDGPADAFPGRDGTGPHEAGPF
jgi:hypothetical protein